MNYDHATTIMTNAHLDSIDSEDGYYLFSEGIEERLGKNNNVSDISEFSGGSNEEMTASDQADAGAEDRLNLNSKTGSVETIDTDSQPTGGFPPIYIVTKKIVTDKKDTKSRELSTRSSAVSIMDILKKKKVEESD